MKSNWIYTVAIFLLASVWLISCAKTGTLTGGPVDKTPPVLVVEKSSPNYITNFTEDEIVLVFDEFVELKQLDKNLLISPPMRYAPKVVQRAKKVTIKIPKEEVLRPNATYSIDMGSSIVDFNAGNKLESFKYVFATGDKIDSLSISGTITDAYTGEGVEGVYLMLYDITTDSIVVQERPFYIVKTMEAGAYKLENLRSDTFKIVTLADQNYNYIYEPGIEAIGFIDSTIVLTDSSRTKYDLVISTPVKEFAMVSNHYRTYGLLNHRFSAAVDTLSIKIQYPSDLNYQVERYQDTLNIWYIGTPDSIGLVVGTDTMVAKVPLLDSTFFNRSLAGVVRGANIAPWDTALFAADAPIAKVDTSLIVLYEKPGVATAEEGGRPDSTRLAGRPGAALDSLQRADSGRPAGPKSRPVPPRIDTNEMRLDTLTLDSTLVSADTLLKVDTVFVKADVATDVRLLQLYATWQEETEYELLLLPGAIVDIYGRANDSLTCSWKVDKESNYGNINLVVTDSLPEVPFLLELYNGEKMVESRTFEGSPTDTIRFSRMQLAKYKIILIEDTDGNGHWSAGDYWLSKQPETLRRYELQDMQPGFDLEASITWLQSATTTETEAAPAAEESERPTGIDKGVRPPGNKPPRSDGGDRE